MATFRQWLTDQESREDQVGYFAKYWRELPDKPKLSSPVSIERHMQQRGLMESTPGLAEGWQVVMTEYRQVNAANNAEREGLTVVRPDQQQAPAADGMVELTAIADPVLAAINLKLDLLLTYFGLNALIPAGSTAADPIDWAAAWATADHDAAIEP